MNPIYASMFGSIFITLIASYCVLYGSFHAVYAKKILSQAGNFILASTAFFISLIGCMMFLGGIYGEVNLQKSWLHIQFTMRNFDSAVQPYEMGALPIVLLMLLALVGLVMAAILRVKKIDLSEY